MEPYFSLAVALLLGGILTFAWNLRNKADTTSENEDHILVALQDLSAKFESDSTSEKDISLLARMEDLEVRFEKLHKEALRFLQSGSQRHRRADAILEGELDEDAQPQNPQEVFAAIENAQPNGQSPETDDIDDLAWAKQKVTESGITPII